MSALSGLAAAKDVRLLIIGEDRRLLDSRRLVLESKGYEVLAVDSLTLLQAVERMAAQGNGNGTHARENL